MLFIIQLNVLMIVSIYHIPPPKKNVLDSSNIICWYVYPPEIRLCSLLLRINSMLPVSKNAVIDVKHFNILTQNLGSGAVGCKTGKTSVLPGFSKIERGGGSSGAPQCYVGLTLRCAGGPTECYKIKNDVKTQLLCTWGCCWKAGEREISTFHWSFNQLQFWTGIGWKFCKM